MVLEWAEIIMIDKESIQNISDALISIRNQYGKSIIRNTNRLRALLNDYCPEYRNECRILMYVFSDDIVMSRTKNDSLSSADVASQLVEIRLGLSREWAKYVII